MSVLTFKVNWEENSVRIADDQKERGGNHGMWGEEGWDIDGKTLNV